MARITGWRRTSTVARVVSRVNGPLWKKDPESVCAILGVVAPHVVKRSA